MKKKRWQRMLSLLLTVVMLAASLGLVPHKMVEAEQADILQAVETVAPHKLEVPSQVEASSNSTTSDTVKVEEKIGSDLSQYIQPTLPLIDGGSAGVQLFNVENTASVRAITIDPPPAKIKVGNKPTLSATVLDENRNKVNGEKVVWTTNNQEIAKFDPKTPGKLLALKEGTVAVTAALENTQTTPDTITLNIEPNSKEIYMRIEGYDRTILPRTKLQIPLYDISGDLGKSSGSSSTSSNGWSVEKFDNPTNAHAIVKALRDLGMTQLKGSEDDAPDKFDFQDYGWGLYIAMIGGYREFDHAGMSGWMYAVNDVLPSIGAQGKELEDGDEVVWYYGAFGFDNVYTKMSANKTDVKAGEKVQVTLTGRSFMDGLGKDGVLGPVKNATILIKKDGVDIESEPSVRTDEKGEAQLVLEKPGKYEISAIRYRENKNYGKETIDIVRPFPVTITVKEKPIDTPPLEQQVSTAIEKAAKQVLEETKTKHFMGDWQALALARAGQTLPDWYLTDKTALIVQEKGIFPKITDYERVTLGVIAAGGNPTNIGGYNLIGKIYNSDDMRGQDMMTRQGTNGVIFALVALDSGNFSVPNGARWDREKLLTWLLNQQTETGGWRLGVDEQDRPGDVDMTAMALISLAPYKDRPEVKAAVERAVTWLSGVQNESGGFGSMWEKETVESAAQVVIALSAHGMDAAGPSFTKKGGNTLTNILSYQQPDGSFFHVKAGTGVNSMSTEQSLQALLAYDYYLKGKGPLYRFGSVAPPDTKEPTLTVTGLTDGVAVKEEKLSFTVTAQDSKGNAVVPNVQVNGKVVASQPPGTYTITLTEGSNIIVIEAVDGAGNRASATYKVSYEKPLSPPGDKEKPTLTVTGLTDGVTVKEEKLSFTVTAQDSKGNAVVPNVQVNGKVVASQPPGTYTITLTEGSNTIVIEAVDGAGNRASMAYTIRYERDNKTKTFYVRIEGYDHTILPRTAITVDNFDLTPYLGPASGSSATPSKGWGPDKLPDVTAMHGIVRAMEQAGINVKDHRRGADIQDYGWGLYVAMIAGEREFDIRSTSGWMYRVNDNLPSIGAQGYKIQNGDEMVWYFAAYGYENAFGKLHVNKTAVKPGEEVEITLIHSQDSDKQPLADAIIYVNGKEVLVDGKPVKTDEHGKVRLKLDKLGSYAISAERLRGGICDLVRPLPITVQVQENPNPGGETPIPGTEKPHLTVKGLTDGAVLKEAGVSFTVTAHDSKGNVLIPVVKVNDKSIEPQADGYHVMLSEGNNTIVVEATDAIGNHESVTYAVRYEKQESNPDALAQQVTDAIEKAASQVHKETTDQHFMGDWQALALTRAGKTLPAWYLQEKAELIAKVNGTFPKITDYERVTLGVIAAGGDPTNIGGYNLIEKIYNSADIDGQDMMTRQGTNGVIFALVALDSGDFSVPNGARWDREKLLTWLLNQQTETGGWRLGVDEQDRPGDVDMTAMALISLAPYKDRPNVKAAVERAVTWLSGVQNESGGFGSMWEKETVESAAQVVIALSAHGMDAAGPSFTKKGGNTLTNILSYQQPDGSFLHVKTGSGVNSMATEQSLQALLAYDYYLKGKGSLYRFGTHTPDPDVKKPRISVTGLTNGATVQKEQLSFTVTATDSKGQALTPVVTLNGTVLAPYETGRYRAILMEGNNTIRIEATDATGNVEQAVYNVQYKKETIPNRDDFVVTPVTDVSLKKGKETPVKVKVRHNKRTPQEVTLVIGIYNADTKKMESYKFVNQTIPENTEQEITQPILVPETGNIFVKAFVWDNLKDMNVLLDKPQELAVAP